MPCNNHIVGTVYSGCKEGEEAAGRPLKLRDRRRQAGPWADQARLPTAGGWRRAGGSGRWLRAGRRRPRRAGDGGPVAEPAATRGERRRGHLLRFDCQRGRAARGLRCASANGGRRRRRPGGGRTAWPAARHRDAHPRRVGHRGAAAAGAGAAGRRAATERPPRAGFFSRRRAVRARGGAARGSRLLQGV